MLDVRSDDAVASSARQAPIAPSPAALAELWKAAGGIALLVRKGRNDHRRLHTYQKYARSAVKSKVKG